MKNFIIITFIIAFIANNKTDAQCISNFPIFTTDPAVNNQQRNGPGKVNNWDWTRDFYSGDVWCYNRTARGGKLIK